MSLRKIICKIYFAWQPDEAKLTLLDAIFYPVKPHVHGAGSFWGQFSGKDVDTNQIIGDDGCFGLWVAEISESVA